MGVNPLQSAHQQQSPARAAINSDIFLDLLGADTQKVIEPDGDGGGIDLRASDSSQRWIL